MGRYKASRALLQCSEISDYNDHVAWPSFARMRSRRVPFKHVEGSEPGHGQTPCVCVRKASVSQTQLQSPRMRFPDVAILIAAAVSGPCFRRFSKSVSSHHDESPGVLILECIFVASQQCQCRPSITHMRCRNSGRLRGGQERRFVQKEAAMQGPQTRWRAKLPDAERRSREDIERRRPSGGRCSEEGVKGGPKRSGERR